jgi:hypothetical protein
MIEVLERAWTSPFKTKSDFARHHADHIAMAASDGFITTKIATGYYARLWQITPKGLSYLYILKGLNHD